MRDQKRLLFFSDHECDAFNLARLAYAVSRAGGTVKNEVGLSVDTHGIGPFRFSEETVPPAEYADYVERFASRYGLEYSCKVSKGKLYTVAKSTDKMQNYTVRESIGCPRDTAQTLFDRARSLAEKEAERIFEGYQRSGDGFFLKMDGQPILRDFAQALLDTVAAHGYAGDRAYGGEDLFPRAFEGCPVWLVVQKEYFGLMGGHHDYDYIWDIKYSAYGRGPLREDQVLGMRMALYKAFYSALRKRYPNLMICPFGIAGGSRKEENGFYLMGLERFQEW